MFRHSPIALIALGLVACKDDPPPPPAKSTATASATAAAPKRSVEMVKRDIATTERKIADLQKSATRTFELRKAKQINAQIETLNKQLAAYKAELAALEPPAP